MSAGVTLWDIAPPPESIGIVNQLFISGIVFETSGCLMVRNCELFDDGIEGLHFRQIVYSRVIHHGLAQGADFAINQLYQGEQCCRAALGSGPDQSRESRNRY
jgi:hypothetical protein